MAVSVVGFRAPALQAVRDRCKRLDMRLADDVNTRDLRVGSVFKAVEGKPSHVTGWVRVISKRYFRSAEDAMAEFHSRGLLSYLLPFPTYSVRGAAIATVEDAVACYASYFAKNAPDKRRELAWAHCGVQVFGVVPVAFDGMDGGESLSTGDASADAGIPARAPAPRSLVAAALRREKRGRSLPGDDSIIKWQRDQRGAPSPPVTPPPARVRSVIAAMVRGTGDLEVICERDRATRVLRVPAMDVLGDGPVRKIAAASLAKRVAARPRDSEHAVANAQWHAAWAPGVVVDVAVMPFTGVTNAWPSIEWVWVPAARVLEIATLSTPAKEALRGALVGKVSSKLGGVPPSLSSVTVAASVAPPAAPPPAPPADTSALLEAVVQCNSSLIAAAAVDPTAGVTVDTAMMEQLISRAKARALQRGSTVVSPRDVRMEADILGGSQPVSSPADELPAHWDVIVSDLSRICQLVARHRGGGLAPPRVLITGEKNGVLASLFKMAGADVATCDLQPTETPQIPHFQGEAALIQDLGWDLVIAHPPCTYLSNAGVSWLHKDPTRMEQTRQNAALYRAMRAAQAPFVAVENSKMHRWARSLTGGRAPDQYVHPWQHGTGHTKATGLELSSSLPPLKPTCLVEGRQHAIARMPPSPDRADKRSQTYKGIGAAMVTQWLPLVIEYIKAHDLKSADVKTALQMVQEAREMAEECCHVAFFRRKGLDHLELLTYTRERQLPYELISQVKGEGETAAMTARKALSERARVDDTWLTRFDEQARMHPLGHGVHVEPKRQRLHRLWAVEVPWSAEDEEPNLFPGQGEQTSLRWRQHGVVIRSLAASDELPFALLVNRAIRGDPAVKEIPAPERAIVGAASWAAPKWHSEMKASEERPYRRPWESEPPEAPLPPFEPRDIRMLRGRWKVLRDVFDHGNRVEARKSWQALPEELDGRIKRYLREIIEPMPTVWEQPMGEKQEVLAVPSPLSGAIDLDGLRALWDTPVRPDRLGLGATRDTPSRSPLPGLGRKGSAIQRGAAIRAEWGQWLPATDTTPPQLGVPATDFIPRGVAVMAAHVVAAVEPTDETSSAEAASSTVDNGTDSTGPADASGSQGEEVGLRRAYPRNSLFVKGLTVTRYAQTRKTAHQRIDVESATVDSSAKELKVLLDRVLADTGAGPSVITLGLLGKLPLDCVISRDYQAKVRPMEGPEGQLLTSHGTADIKFEIDNIPYRCVFNVVEGRPLMLLGNDFLDAHRATIGLNGDGTGQLTLDLDRKGDKAGRRDFRVSSSLEPPQVVGAVSPAPGNTGNACGITGPSSSTSQTQALPEAEMPTAPDHAKGALRLKETEHLLYSEHSIFVPSRSKVTTRIRVPLELAKQLGACMMIDRIPTRPGLENPPLVEASIQKIASDGRVDVTVWNSSRRGYTVPSFSPLAHLVAEFYVSEVRPDDAVEGDPLSSLTAEQRATIDKVEIDPQGVLTEEQKLLVRGVLAKHVRAFALDPKDPTHTHLMEVELPLKADAVPHRHPPAKLGDKGREIVEQHVADMESRGIIRKSNSAWGSRVVLVSKKDGSVRFCVDYRDLNSKLKLQDSPIPLTTEALDRLGSGTGSPDSLFLSTLDLASGFWCMAIKEEDKPLTAFVTHRQKYEFNYLPFGIQSGPSYMCRLMDAALQGLAWDTAMPYLDDVGVWSTGTGDTHEERCEASFAQMLQRIDTVLERLEWAGLSCKASKCQLFATKALYLGHEMTRDGLRMDPKKISAVKDIDSTKINSLEAVRSFLGLCSYYRRFVRDFSNLAAPLTDLTKSGVDVEKLSQEPVAQKAIQALKDAITSEPVLAAPRFDREFILKTDGAQTEGIGGVLSQVDDEGHERVVAYYGRRLKDAERNYTVTEIELLAAMESIRNWRPYLWGRQFRLVIDHAALKWLHTMRDTMEGGPASRLMRWILKLAEYRFTVEHKPGKKHWDADGISRLMAAPVSHTDSPLVSKIMFISKGKILTGWRKDARKRPDQPQLYAAYAIDAVGGKGDADETALGAAIREFDEEFVGASEALRSRVVDDLSTHDPMRSMANHQEINVWVIQIKDPVLQEELLRLGNANPEWTQATWESASFWQSSRDLLPMFNRPTSRRGFGPKRRSYLVTLMGALDDFVRLERSVPPAISSLLSSVLEEPETGPSGYEPMAALVAATAQAGVAQKKRAQIVTARRLQGQERDKRRSKQTRSSVIQSYLSTGAPNKRVLREAQEADADCQAIARFLEVGHAGDVESSEGLKRAVWIAGEARHMLQIDGVLMRQVEKPHGEDLWVPYVPDALRWPLLTAFHDHLGHQGKVALSRLLRDRFYWPAIDEDASRYCSECHECTLAKLPPRRARDPRSNQDLGRYPFDVLYCDVLSMAPTHDYVKGKSGYDKLLIYVDSLSRWVEAIPFNGDPSSAQILDVFMTDIVSRHGAPRRVISDAGSNLASQLCEAVLEETGVDLKPSSAEHHETVGVVERFNATLQGMTRAADEGGAHWVDHLPFLLMSYRATPNRTTKQSPAELLYGRQLRLPSQMDQPGGVGPSVEMDPELPEPIRDYAKKLHDQLVYAWVSARALTREQQNKEANATAVQTLAPPTYQPGDRVCRLLFDNANNLMYKYAGPYRVEVRLPNGRYRLKDLENKMLDEDFNVANLRPYRTQVDAEALKDDEYIVDRLLETRGTGRQRQFKVKWRGYPLSAATWVGRAELMRRCEELVLEMERERAAAAHAPDDAPGAAAEPLDVMPPVAAADAGAAPRDENAYHSDDTPTTARFVRGQWSYGRYVATPRGRQLRWFAPSAFTTDEIESDVFEALRTRARQGMDPVAVTVLACLLNE